MVELSEADEEGDEHKEQLEQELDNDEVQLADSKRRQLERGLADAGDDEAKKKELTDAFNADMKASAEKLAADREAKRAALAARLAKRKAAVEAKIDNALGESVELGTIAKQKQERASLEEEEEDSASKTAAGELMASYTKDNDELSRARRAKREAAQQKLQARRAKLAEKHKKELANAGVPEEVAAEIVKQEEETADKEFKQREAQEEQMDKKHAEEAKAEESALQAKLKAAEEAKDEAAKVAIVREYQETQQALAKKQAADRKAKREALNARLERKKKAMKNKHKEQVADCAGERAVEVLAEQETAKTKLDSQSAALTASKAEIAAEREKHQKELADLKAKADAELEAMRRKFEDKQRQFDELAAQKFEDVPSHGFAGGAGEEAEVKAIIGQYQVGLQKTAQKTEKTKVVSKDKLKQRLEAKRKAMEFKAIQAQKILEG